MSRPISLLTQSSKTFQRFNVTFSMLNRLPLTTSQHVVTRWRSSTAAAQLKTLPQDVDTILSNARAMDKSQTVALLKALRVHTLFNGKNLASTFVDDARFQDLCVSFERGCNNLHPSQLVSGLRSLLEVGLSPTTPCVVAAERRILEAVKDMEVSHLVGCLYYHHRFTQSPLQRRVVTELIHEIPQKADDLQSPSEILMLVHIFHLFQGQHQKRFEEKIVELVPSMKSRELYKLLITMGERSIRNVPILKAVGLCLRQRSMVPDLKETVDLMYVFKKLNFYDPLVYGHLLNHLPDEIGSVKQGSLISGLLTVCGHLRWRHTGILDACAKWIEQNFETCKSRELVSFVLSTAALNYSTEKTKLLLDRIVPQLMTDGGPKSPSVLLDIVWSLAVLESVPKELLLKVLSKEFHNSLVAESQSTFSHHLKLLNLKGVLRKEHPECVFGCDLYLEPIKLSESPVIESCRQHVAQVLSNFVPKDKCLCTHQVTDTGVFIDAEFIMNKQMKPVSLKTYGILSKPESTVKDLPSQAKRLSLLVLFHKDLTLCSRVLTGANALGVRLLQNAGYTPVTILYDEFSENKTELQKAKYLLEKIKEVSNKTS